MHGDEPRTWVSTGVGRGPGGGGVGGDGMKNLQGTVAIEITDKRIENLQCTKYITLEGEI